MVDEPSPEPAVELDARAWPTVEPPAGFAERAVAAFLDEGGATASQDEPAPRRSRRIPVIAAATALAAAMLVWLAWPGRGGARGDVVASEETRTIAMGDRAIAVARPGSALHWEVDADGEARISQDAGRVFYRVDEGGAFEVKTPAGTVTVTGTCFEVETRTMTKSGGLKGAVLGAALASAVVVTVYEGGVVLANERGDVALAPGERGLADPGVAPRREDGDAAGEYARGSEGGDASSLPMATVDDAVAQVRRQARALEQAHADQLEQEREIGRLRRQVTELGGNPGEPSPAELKVRARECAGQGRGGECPFLEPDEATLLEMARCASVKVDFPGFLDNVESPQVGGYAESLGITDAAEVAALQAAADKHYADFNGRLREIFVALGGDPALAEEASAATMKSYIADQLDRELTGDVQRRVAEERAGLREPPADASELSLEERAFRLHAELGNEFEAYLGEQLGAERARQLRKVNDGWPGSTSVNSGECIE